MTAQTIYSIPPTVLLVEKHEETGLLYFHKTSRLELIGSYQGNGKYWLRHLKKHGGNVKTVWVSEVFTDSTIVDVALNFSHYHDIVESTLWANLIPENGLDGRPPGINVDGMGEKIKKTMLDSEWKATVGVELHIKRVQNTDWESRNKDQSNTLNNPEWKATVGVRKIELYKQTINDSEWKATVGVERTKKRLEKTDFKKRSEKDRKKKQALHKRPIVYSIKEIAEKNKIKLGSGWWQKPDSVLEEIYERLRNDL